MSGYRKIYAFLSFGIFILGASTQLHAQKCTPKSEAQKLDQQYQVALGEYFCPKLYVGKPISFPGKGKITGVSISNNRASAYFYGEGDNEFSCDAYFLKEDTGSSNSKIANLRAKLESICQ